MSLNATVDHSPRENHHESLIIIGFSDNEHIDVQRCDSHQENIEDYCGSAPILIINTASEDCYQRAKANHHHDIHRA